MKIVLIIMKKYLKVLLGLFLCLAASCSGSNGGDDKFNLFVGKAFIGEQKTWVSSGTYGYEVLYFEDNKNGTSFYVDKNHNILLTSSPEYFTYWISGDTMEITYHYSDGDSVIYFCTINSPRAFTMIEEMTDGYREWSYVYDPFINLMNR